VRRDREGERGGSCEDEANEGLGKNYYITNVVEGTMHGIVSPLASSPMLPSKPDNAPKRGCDFSEFFSSRENYAGV
jgi:hypothetical protein